VCDTSRSATITGYRVSGLNGTKYYFARAINPGGLGDLSKLSRSKIGTAW
jgi:hypothetical protein